MKSIMLSIKPQYVCSILNNTKILEIRKKKPKCKLPCKVYIYCTKGKYCKESLYLADDNKYDIDYYVPSDDNFVLNGKVVAEFTLNKIDKIEICDPYIFRNNKQEDWKYFEKNACLNCEQMMEYIGYGEDHDGWDKKYAIGYAWHIDNLIIYDKPKELSEFEKYGSYKIITYCYKKQHGLCNKGYGMKGNYVGCEKARIKKPPQSWCYVEEKGEEV